MGVCLPCDVPIRIYDYRPSGSHSQMAIRFGDPPAQFCMAIAAPLEREIRIYDGHILKNNAFVIST